MQNADFKMDKLETAIQEIFNPILSKRQTGQSLIKQQSQPAPMSFPNLQPYLDPVRSYIKTAYRTYLLLTPEIKMVQCLYKHLYVEYPRLMGFFRIQTLRLLIRRAYRLVVHFFRSILDGSIFPSIETAADKERVAQKVAMITKEKPKKSVKPTTSQLNWTNYGAYGLPQSTPNYNYAYYRQPSAAYQQRSAPNFVYQRVKRQTAQFPRQTINTNSQIPMNYQLVYTPQSTYTEMKQPLQSPQPARPPKQSIHPSQFVDNPQDFDDMDPDAKIDLSNPNIQYEADQLFNMDSMLWRSIGVEDKTIRKYSLAYCGKEYVTDIMRRFVKNVILS